MAVETDPSVLFRSWQHRHTAPHQAPGEMQYQQVGAPCELAATADDVLNALFGELERQAAPTDGTTPGVCLALSLQRDPRLARRR